MKKIAFVLLNLVALSFTACSNLEIGVEKESVFHSDQKQENLKNSIVNVYLDTSTLNKDKFRLVINGEDTELDLYYDVITRFQINQKNTVIDLLKNNQKVMSIPLVLRDKKNYYLIIKQDENHSLIQEIDKQSITKGTKATPIFVSEEALKEEEIQTLKKVEELHTEEKKDLKIKHNIGLNESENVQSKQVEVKHVKAKEVKKTEVKEVTQEVPSNKSLQERYEAGESIFYYDPNDGE